MKPTIRVSVRTFVEFLLRSGDIDSRRGGGSNADAMLEGSRIHRRIQQSKGPEYRAEVPLKMVRETEGYFFTLEGRADGIITEETGVTIDEIKGIYGDPHKLEKPVSVHLGQAKCYAYIVMMERDLEHISVQMTYCNLDDMDIRIFTEHYEREELIDWFEGLVAEYQKWIDMEIAWKKVRKDSTKRLEFPYEYREGQSQLVKDVYRSIIREKTLFIQAPTGVGKTISTVFPAVKAVGEEAADKIFYLTAKNITRTAAADAFSLLMSKGYRGKVLTITAKDKVCPLEERKCNPEDCPYARAYFDRVNDAVYEFVQGEGLFDRERLVEYALQKELCPFEFSLDVSLWCDAILCDYNYLYDPNVYLRRFFPEGIKGDYIFLVDEAHNLIERGREMYSAVLYKEDMLKQKNYIEPFSKRIAGSLKRCNTLMLEYKRECDEYLVPMSVSPLILSLNRLMSDIENYSKDHPEFVGTDEWSQFYLDLRHFLNMVDRMNESYTAYMQHDEEGRFYVKLYCMDTAGVLTEMADRGKSVVYFSATLLPIRYYREMLTTHEEHYAVYANSAFSPAQSLIVAATDVSSKYTRRNRKEYERIALYIQKVVRAKKGNYLVFFPSYQFMESVVEVLKEVGDVTNTGEEKSMGEYTLLPQTANMTEAEKEAFLAEFREDRADTLVGCCVMGGAFSEGIDLTNNRLIGAIIVGTGLPQISNEKTILKEHYEEVGKNGFDYAYRFPGMNKVLQAAGRVIRTVDDRGVIVLLDDRFGQWEYKELFPREWSGMTTCRVDTIEEKLHKFWENK